MGARKTLGEATPLAWDAPHFDQDGNAIAGGIVDPENTPPVQANTDALAAAQLRAENAARNK